MPKIVPKAPAFATTEHRNNIASVHSDGEDPVANSNVEDAASTTTGGTGSGVVAQHGSGSEHAAASNNSGEEPDAENLLVNMFLSSEEAYSRYRNPYPKRKKDICNEWAKAINKKGVTKIRKGKDVQNKIESIENQMKLAQDFADSDTGQGLQESDPDSFDAAILLRCKFYSELRDIFIKRAGMKPLATTETMLRHSDDEDDDDDDDDGDNMFGNNHDDGFSSSDDGNSNNDCKNDVSCSGSNADNAALDLTGDDSNDDEDVVIVDESTKSRRAKNSDCSSGTTPQQKKGGKDKEVAKATRKKGSDKKTTTDYDQFIEFSTKYKKIKENLGSGVQAALQFPEFERLLSPAEKSELHDQRMV